MDQAEQTKGRFRALLTALAMLSATASVAMADTVGTLDRYGASRAQPAPNMVPSDQAYLSWSGKVIYPAQPVSASPPAPSAPLNWGPMGSNGTEVRAGYALPAQSYAPAQQADESRLPPPPAANFVPAWIARQQLQAQAQAAQSAPPVAQETTAPVFNSPRTAPAAPPTRTASLVPPANPSGAQSGPRLYSLHREYGMTPDPLPIPPDAFTQSADLAGEDAAAATPQPGPKTAAGRAAIVSQRISDNGDQGP
jgi:hypothetical protein